MRLSGISTLLSVGLLLTEPLLAAPQPQAVPMTIEELAKQLGIEHERWRLSFDQPVVARIWISETIAGKTTRVVAKAEITEPTTVVTYQVILKRGVSVKDPGAWEIGIDVAGEDQSEGLEWLFNPSDVKSSSWGFTHRVPHHDLSLDKAVILFSWHQKLRRGREGEADADPGSGRLIEVKMQISTPTPNGSPSPAP